LLVQTCVLMQRKSWHFSVCLGGARHYICIHALSRRKRTRTHTHIHARAQTHKHTHTHTHTQIHTQAHARALFFSLSRKKTRNTRNTQVSTYIL
jgi:hypothetical protein